MMAAMPALQDWRAHLRSAALRCLAQREHTRLELRTKLLRQAQRRTMPTDDGPEQVAAFVDTLLAELQAQGWQSDSRRADSLVRTKSARWGERRLRQTLQRSGVDAADAAAALLALQGTELQRALAVWRRRFGQVATTPADRGRQARFLAGRGFSADVIRQVVRGLADGADGTDE